MHDIAVTGTNLSGVVVWGPTRVSPKLSADELRQLVASTLHVRVARLALVRRGSTELVQGPRSLKALGFLEDCDLQLVLEDCSEEIREIQKAICGNGRAYLQPGLTEEELERVELRYGFKFPPDVQEFLQVGVPLGGGWHDWRKLSTDEVPVGSKEDTVAEVIKCHCTPSRVRYSKDRPWVDGFGAESFDGGESLEVAVELATRVYPLIPLRLNRCILSLPRECGLPVISMHGCYDNLCYGSNFWAWLEKDCGVPEGLIPSAWKEKNVPLYKAPFWQHWYEM